MEDNTTPIENPAITTAAPVITSPTYTTLSTVDSPHIFAIPKDPAPLSTKPNTNSSHNNQQPVNPVQLYYKVIDSDSNIIQVESTNNQRFVDITTVDDRPMLYKVHPPQVTDSIQPWKLPEAFSAVPFPGFAQDKEELLTAQRSKIKEFIGDSSLSSETFERLEMYCSPENLMEGNEFKIDRQGDRDLGFDYMDLTNYGGNREPTGEAENLQSIKKYKLRVELDESNIYPRKLKYRGFRYVPLINDFQPVSSPEEALVPGKDLLFRIRVYRPFDYNPRHSSAWSLPSISRCPIFAHDLILSGRHSLAAIRDAISCINEHNLRVDISDNHTNKPPITCKTLFPSGFLYINNAFYSDQRQNCNDLTAPLVEWARKNRIGDLPTFSMDTRLDTITIKLGYPDVYVHQGDCEHTFSFADIRLVTACDPLTLSAYPAQSSISKSHEAYCTTCADKVATRLVAECVRVPFDPAFMCDTCFDLYLYDKDGKKICDFIAYDYVKE